MLYKLKLFFRVLVALLGRHRWPVSSSKLVILGYHRVIPESDERFGLEQPTMLVTPDTFENNICWAKKYFKFISLTEWVERCQAGDPPQGKYCAITFDDGWIDNYEFAFPLLKKHDVPATIFCVEKMIDDMPDYWPGRLVRLIARASDKQGRGEYINYPHFAWLKDACLGKQIAWINPEQRDFDAVVECCKVYSDTRLHSMIDQTARKMGDSSREQRQVVNSAEIAEMISSGLVTIGSHTKNHIRMSDATEEGVLDEEILQSKLCIQKKLDCDIKLFCYPNGYHPINAVELARSCYLGACTLEEGWNTPDMEYMKLKRVGIHQAVASNKYVFESRLTGWV